MTPPPAILLVSILAMLAVDPVRADEAHASNHSGLRKLTSTHLTLYTDLPANAEVDALPKYFDQAFPQWCAYFKVDPQKHATWHVRGCLMKARERFEADGLLPTTQRVNTGYALADRLWLFDQAGDYYRRHLLLHEGTHAFMYAVLGDVGPPWFAEGLAELLGTHRLENGMVTLNVMPAAREEVPLLGRIEIVQHAVRDRPPKALASVLDYPADAYLENDAYAWSWALAAFLDGDPRYRDRFRDLPRHLATRDVGPAFRQAFDTDWQTLNEDWQLFAANLDFGYDFGRMQFDRQTGKPLPASGAQASVAADRGWQSSGVHLEAGRTYRLRATGRYRVAETSRPWECEPAGVTIQYYRGQPLGILLAALHGPRAAGEPLGLLEPSVVGLGSTITPKQSGTLYLRINESAGHLSDNSGAATVEIVAE